MHMSFLILTKDHCFSNWFGSWWLWALPSSNILGVVWNNSQGWAIFGVLESPAKHFTAPCWIQNWPVTWLVLDGLVSASRLKVCMNACLHSSKWVTLAAFGTWWRRVVQGGVHPQDQILYRGARVLAEAWMNFRGNFFNSSSAFFLNCFFESKALLELPFQNCIMCGVFNFGLYLK